MALQSVFIANHSYWDQQNTLLKGRNSERIISAPVFVHIQILKKGTKLTLFALTSQYILQSIFEVCISVGDEANTFHYFFQRVGTISKEASQIDTGISPIHVTFM